MPDIVAEAAAFFNETGRDPEFDLSLPLVWGYVLGPLRQEQIEPVTALLGEQGFMNVEPALQEGSHELFEVFFSEVRVHTLDSYADRIRGLAELAEQHGLEVVDWSIEALPEDWQVEAPPARAGVHRPARIPHATGSPFPLWATHRRPGAAPADEQPADPLAPRMAESFALPFEADVVRFRLELEGIPSRLADEAMAGWFWQYSNAVGGVKLLVRAEDLPRALEIMDSEAEAAAAALPFEGGQTAAPGGGFPPPRVPRRWACPRCAARVPSDFCVCWACGTTADGQTDSKFGAVDAPAVEIDRDRASALWAAVISVVYLLFVLRWPAALLLFLPMGAYEMLSYLLPERATERRKRRATFVPLAPRLRRACILAVFADGLWPIPFSLWLLGKVGRRSDAQRRRHNTFFVLALTMDLMCVGLVAVFFLIFFLR
jgi:hypothetical protein